jgi:transposase
MNAVVADYPDQEIHVVLDNLRTHKPKRDQWLACRKNVHFHFTPTHASWLNQVEIWFSILARSTLDAASFTSVQALRAAIDALHRSLQRQRPAPPVAPSRDPPQSPRLTDRRLMQVRSFCNWSNDR